MKWSARISYFTSCPNKDFCPVELSSFLPAERRLPGYMIFFPVLCKDSPRIYDFLSCPQKGFWRRYYFLSCPLKRRLHGNIILFPACRKTFGRIYFYLLPVERLFPRYIIFMFCPLKGFCPDGLFSFLPLEWLLPVSLSPRIKFHSRSWGVHRVSVSLTSLRASDVSCVWSRYRSSSRGGALFNVSIFKVPTDSVFIESLLSRIFSHRYMHTGGALSHFLSCANLLVHDWVLIILCGRRKAKKFPLLKLSSPLPVAKEKTSFGFRNPDARSKEEPIKKLPKASLRDRGLKHRSCFSRIRSFGYD